MKTNVAILLDESGSMGHLWTHAKRMVNDILDSFRELERTTGQEYYINLYTFDNVLSRRYGGTRAAETPTFTGSMGGGMTALYDAVIGATQALPLVSGRSQDANLVIVVTDGNENASYRYATGNDGRFKGFVAAKQADDHHTFVFHVPRGSKARFVLESGVSEGNVEEWDQTEEGTQAVTAQHQNSLQNYAAVRSAGKMSSQTYFARSDVSTVTQRDLANAAVPRSRFNTYTVGAESVAKEFAEKKTKSRYIIGQLFYQLIKPEVVQENKELVLRDKTTGQFYAGGMWTSKVNGQKYPGKSIRSLIGLPAARCKVDPGNHANYDVFVQSTSVNRILPRGTKVLIDTTRLSDLKPTWDHTAVKPKVENTILTPKQKKLIGVK